MEYNDFHLPAGVEEIGDFAFAGCRSIGQSDMSIGMSLVGSIHLPWALRKLGAYAFQGCTGIWTVTIDENLTAIPKGAFMDCTGMEWYTCRQITEIGEYAFAGCTALRTVDLPKTLEKIGYAAYEGCRSLQNPVFPERFRENIPIIFGDKLPEGVEFK